MVGKAEAWEGRRRCYWDVWKDGKIDHHSNQVTLSVLLTTVN